MVKISKVFALPLLLALLAVFVFGFSHAPAAAANQNKLVAYYTFDGDLQDSSGNGNNGFAKGTGEITFKDSKVGKGAVFNGSNYVEVADSNSLDLSNAFTFAAWIYKEKTDNIVIPLLSKSKSDDFFTHPYRYFLGYGGFNPGVTLVAENESDNDEASSNAQVGAQNWTHVAVTWDGENVKFYKNGLLTDEMQTEYVESLLRNDQKLIIGMDTSDGTIFFKGIMDELRIYNYALADKEVKSLVEVKTQPVESPQAPSPTPAPAPVPGSDITQGLVASYSFESVLNDTSGNNNNGTAVGSITFVDAKIGKGAKFDGASYVEVADSDSLDLGNAFTFATWVYKEKTDNIVIPLLSKSKSDDFFTHPYRYFLGYGSLNPGVTIVAENESDNDEASSKAQVGAQNWTHVAVTWDGKNVKFYKNGILTDEMQTEYVESLLRNDQKLIIGMDTSDGTIFFKGVMDELRIYNRALTEKEIQALASGGGQQAQTGKLSIVLEVNNSKMTVNGVQKEVDPGYGTTPVVLNGRAMVPIRTIVEQVGGNIGFDPKEQKISINAGSDSIEFWAGKKTYRVNGIEKTTDVPPAVMNGRTFLPLRVATENLGAKLDWDSVNQRITINFGQ